jgi:LuxR family maltose regulon positive regulatory protein
MNAWGRGPAGTGPGDENPVGRPAAAPDLAAAPLIVTKLTVPALPRGAICRERLHQLLGDGTQGRLMLVVAPAGFGKTVLAASWLLARPGRRAGWVSLDAGDDEPSRFWAYVLAAADGAGAGLELPAGALAEPAAPPEAALVPLVNALAALSGDLVLVLDDYHLITDPRIHHGVAFLLGQQLPRLHLVILTRADPPFPLARQMASGQVIQARTGDLAFTAGEMALFLDQQQVTLPGALQEPLFARLGGWAAALRLVTLWVAGREDPAVAIAEFAASDATIADYLTVEVLGQLPAGLRRFLLCTSILPRLTGPLCDAVTGDAAGSGAQVLAELDRRGLFVEALTPGRDWLRYHQLFAELLRLELQRAYPETVQELHRRASRWFAAHGHAAEAIDHGLAGQDWAGVRMLMLSETLAIGIRYPAPVIAGWLALVPRRVREASPFFLTLDAYLLGHAGCLQDARRALHRARELAAVPGAQPELPELAALGHMLRAGIARLDCDLPAARAAAQAVDRELPGVGEDQSALARMTRASTDSALAATMFWHGDTAAAARLLDDTDRETATHHLTRMRVNCLSATALLQATAGQLRQAETLAAQALDLARPVGATTMFQTNPALLAAAVVSLHRAEHTQARQQLAAVAERAARHQDRAPLLAARTLLARLAALDGDLGAAFALLDDAKAAAPRWQPPPALDALTAEEEARLCLLSGDIAAARAVHTHLQTLPGQVPAVTLAQQVTRARILQAEGHGAAASDWFSTAAGTALSCGLLPAAVEALAGAAIASWSAGQAAGALDCLERALTLAWEETIVAPFLWQAARVRPLLLAMEQGLGQYPALGLRQRLLAAMGVPARLPLPGTGQAAAAAGLSGRELTVLRLLRGTLTGPEIAATLALSPNTLKTHLRHIYRKLGVTSRQQAITRSRELGLP